MAYEHHWEQQGQIVVYVGFAFNTINAVKETFLLEKLSQFLLKFVLWCVCIPLIFFPCVFVCVLTQPPVLLKYISANLQQRVKAGGITALRLK